MTECCGVPGCMQVAVQTIRRAGSPWAWAHEDEPRLHLCQQHVEQTRPAPREQGEKGVTSHEPTRR